MGVNPKSMVSKGPEYGLPEPGRRSAAGTACIRGRFPTMSEPAPILLRYELVAQSHRRSSKIPRPTATPAYLTPPSARPFRARRRLRCRGTGPSTQFYCPRAIASNRRPVIPSEVGDRLEVWHQPPREPDQLNVALRLPFQQ